jgi:predicted dehydrogenase
MTPEQKELGRANFHKTTEGLSRRGFMKTMVAGTALPISAAAFFGYEFSRVADRPVRAAIIGTGDEGGVLIGEHNPRFLQFVAFSDIRPSNYVDTSRTFFGQPGTPRRGFIHHYGPDAAADIRHFIDYKEMLRDQKLGIEMVVIALPLHLHAPVAIDCLHAGKHVLCEKLMAWNIAQCKDMIRVADQEKRMLAIGHQRHYSMLYAQANEVVKAGVLGDVKHLRALWHRNNAWYKVDANGKEIPGSLKDSWKPDIKKEDREALETLLGEKYDYKSMEELVRWRLYERTGGGLMAELGSHQLDACSIFLGKKHPLAVTGVGGKYYYSDDREVDDHVFVTFEFPGAEYHAVNKDGEPIKGKNGESIVRKPKDDRVVVTYSSISTNAFETYGECLMGSRGTMVVAGEQQVMLFAERNPYDKDSGSPRATSVSVTSAARNAPVLDASATSGPADSGPAAAQAVAGGGAGGPVSRGYREEMEDFAYCVRMYEQAGSEEERKKWLTKPRCHGRVAMADAIIALASNAAMQTHQRIEFNDKWFDAASEVIPEWDRKATNHKGEEIKQARS